MVHWGINVKHWKYCEHEQVDYEQYEPNLSDNGYAEQIYFQLL